MRRPWTVGLVVAASATAIAPGAAEATTQTFTANGTFTVPSGVTTVAVDVLGAQGGSASAGTTPGGKGGEATGTLSVTAGEQLTVLVGGQGATASGTQGAQGGANGGGPGGGGAANSGGGGGGRSEVDRGATRLLVAGGGGGGSPAQPTAHGGPGGGLTGGDGGFIGEGGEGGTQTTPGAGGGDVGSPAVGQTGTGAAGGKGGEGGDFFGGGGGGGGWFGGGGGSGGNADDAGGGGGGSGHVDASVTESTLDSDVQEGSGLVTITYESATSTSLSSAPNPSSAGSTVTFTAMVTGTSPTGPVAFSDGGTPVPGCEGVELGTGGNTRTAVCQTASLGVGTHVIRALYKGDADNAASESTPLSQVVSGNGSSSATPTASSTSTTAAATPPPLLAPPTPVEPSNAFRFARVRVSARELRLRFDYPGDGTLDALVTTHRLGASAARLRPGPNRLSVGKLHDSASGAQTKTLRVRLTSRGRQILARRGKLPIRLSLVFTPTGGQSARQTHKYTVRG